MAKQGGSFLNAPWVMKPAQLDDFVLITEANKKNAMVIGRIIYVIDDAKTKTPKYGGYKTFDPCFKQGLYRITLPSFWSIEEMKHPVPADQDKKEWDRFWVAIINDGIKRERLFIKKNEPLIKYFKL